MTRLKKRFGQHFLHDQNVIANITQNIAPTPDDFLIEIGPGGGALTTHLLRRLSTLTVVELDRDLIGGLQKISAQQDTPIDIINADILSLDLGQLTQSNQRRARLVGNLPYNISTPIIFACLAVARQIKDMHFLMQNEVVNRLAARPGSKIYGRLSVMVQYACQAEKLFEVSPNSFTPPPKVNSALVRLTPYVQPPYPADNESDLNTVVRSAFSQRRKTITNSLRKLINATEITELNIDPKSRPEQLSVEQFVRLSNHVSSQN